MKISFLALVVLCATQIACVTQAKARSFPTSEKARAVVATFESVLAKVPEENERERIRLSRDFFAGLKDSDVKLAAIGLTNNRYVYYVPRSIMSELLGKLLDDTDIEVRSSAAFALGYVAKAGDYAEKMIALLKHEDPLVRKDVLYGMGHSGSDAFFEPLKASLHDPDASVRSGASFEFWFWLKRQEQQRAEFDEKYGNGFSPNGRNEDGTKKVAIQK